MTNQHFCVRTNTICIILRWFSLTDIKLNCRFHSYSSSVQLCTIDVVCSSYSQVCVFVFYFSLDTLFYFTRFSCILLSILNEMKWNELREKDEASIEVFWQQRRHGCPLLNLGLLVVTPHEVEFLPAKRFPATFFQRHLIHTRAYTVHGGNVKTRQLTSDN